MKFCKDCIHYDISGPLADAEPARYARCNYTNGRVNPVTGDPAHQKYDYCGTLRSCTDADTCGAEARFFEPRQDTGVKDTGVNQAIDQVAELRTRTELAESVARLNAETIRAMQSQR